MMRTFILAVVFTTMPLLVHASSTNHKKQDADYVKEVCKIQRGQTEVYVSKRSRVDCVTAKYVIEVDYADLWKRNIDQALRYGKDSGKKAKLVLVVEDKSELSYVKKARAEVKLKSLNLEIETFENFESREQSLAEIDGPPIKKSKSGGKCHVKGHGSYGQTKKFVAFQTMQACVASGGVKAKNAGI